MGKFKKVVIIGVGLIGGSVGMAVRKHRLAGQVVGISRRKSTLDKAKSLGAIDEGSRDIAAVKGADLVIFAAPARTIPLLARKSAKFISRGCLVTDVASTKKEVSGILSLIFPGYVGSHPLAGSEKSGVAYAYPDLFKGSLCLLTPERKSCPQALSRLNFFWKKLGARTFSLPPAQHDRALSLTSHLPHALAFALISSLPAKLFPFTAGGFRDTTRIAASESSLWRDIFLSNRANMLQALSLFESELSRIKSAIRRKDAPALGRLLRAASARRKALGLL